MTSTVLHQDGNEFQVQDKKCECGQTIFFGLDAGAQRIPLTVSPAIYLVTDASNPRTVRVQRVKGRVFVTHFATCTKAAKFSKSGQGDSAMGYFTAAMRTRLDKAGKLQRAALAVEQILQERPAEEPTDDDDDTGCGG